MKRKLFTTLLTLALFFSFHAVAHAQEAASDTVSVDLSASILQSGGLPKETPEIDISLRNATLTLDSESTLNPSTYSSTNYKKIEAVLLNAFDSFQSSIDLTKYNITRSDFLDIFSDVLNNNHRYFYVSGSLSYSIRNGYVTNVSLSYTYNKTTATAMLKKYDSAISLALNGVSDSWSDMEKALYINDYLAQNCEYDSTLSKFSAYNALVDKTAVCQGYSLAYKALASELGLNCEIVSSYSLNHAWNMIEINGEKYHVDVTWNDPVGNTLGKSRHTYFMKSTSYFKKDHYIQNDWQVTGSWSASSAKTTTYDTYFWDDVEVGFYYLKGYWYTFDGSNIIKCECDGTSFTKVNTEIKIKDVWSVIDSENGYSGYWQGTYTGIGSYGEYLYYSSPDTIYKYNVSKKTASVFYELTDTQKKSGHIFGIQISSNGTVSYYFHDTPSSGGKIYKVSSKANTTTQYTIIFNGNGATSGSSYKLSNCKYETAYPLPANKFKRSNYVFKEWNTKASGKGTAYKNKASVKNLTKTNGGIVNLYAQWEKIGINTKKKTIYVGSTYTLKLTGTTIRTTSSDNKKVATVSAKGKVTAKKAGTATITLKGKNGKSYKCKVTVKKPYINAQKKTLKVGKSYTLKLTGTSIKKTISSSPKVATVSSKGKVTAKKKGTTTITLKGTDGKSYKCRITVKK